MDVTLLGMLILGHENRRDSVEVKSTLKDPKE
jgi:hypothetical protein